MSRSTIKARSRSCLQRQLLAPAALMLLLPVSAQAQSVNYGELEEMFGEPVTTSVTGKPQRVSETPAALVIITREDIRRSPARDIVGLIRAYAGIDIARWTGGQSDVSIRGGVQPYNARLLVLVNGQQVYLDHYGLTNWPGIGVQLEEIQQIEIVRGPNSALFGFNAASGVINIITVNPLQTRQITGTIEGGSHEHARASLSAALKLTEGVGLRLSGGYGKGHELHELKQFVAATAPGQRVPDPKHFEGAAELYAKLSDRTEATLSANHSYTRRTDLLYLAIAAPAFNRFTSFGGRVAHDTDWGTLSGRIYRNKADIEAPIAVLPDNFEIHNKVLVASADTLVRIGSTNTMRLGFEYRDNQLTSDPGLPGATRYGVYAASAMWESTIREALTFTLAGRVDHLSLRQQGVVDQPGIFTKKDYNRSLTEWSFNSAIVLKLDDATTIRAAAARGVQAPSLFSLGSRLTLPIPGLPFPVVQAGDPSLAPSVIWSGEVGIARAFEAISGHGELTAFYNHTKDIIGAPVNETPPVAAPPAFPYILQLNDNVGSFEAYGIEASLTGGLGKNLTWHANYTWTHAQQDIEGETEQSFRWPIILDRSTPEHKVKAQLSYDRNGWLGTVAGRYTSRTQQLVNSGGSLQAVDIPASLAIDAKVAWKVGDQLTLELAGENLTGAKGVDLSPFAAERRLRATARVQF